MSSDTREFKDIRHGTAVAEALPVEEFMASLEQVQADICVHRNQVWERVADGTLSVEYLKRFCKEYYFLGKWYTSEFGSIVSNAPDADALDLATSEHFVHWLQNLADETGFTGDRNHVDMKVEWARMMGITDEVRRPAEGDGAVAAVEDGSMELKSVVCMDMESSWVRSLRTSGGRRRQCAAPVGLPAAGRPGR